jgi:sphingomyelin phosphodiesterase acid-like 3
MWLSFRFLSFRFLSFRSLVLTIISLSCLSMEFAPISSAQSPGPKHASPKTDAETIPALFISDVHFDPFHDPAKVKDLVAAPVSEWSRILATPPSPDQQQAFETLQQTCHARGVDTPLALLRSSLEAMRARQPDAKFMMVSGDLIAHAFTCRFSTLFPESKPGNYQTFVLKTLSFVMEQLRSAFPAMPVYVALGNNDSGCGDYQLDEASDFLLETGKIVAEGLPPLQRQHALKQSWAGGYYSVAMAEPMRGTRLIVVNDLFFSGKYSSCAGKPDLAAASAQLSWLAQQLGDARAAGQKVWVMGHIPPGIDPYSTVAKFRDVCGGKAPVTFLASDKMADLLVEYADVVLLGIFAHTHMDEMRLLKPEGSEPPAGAGHQVAIKMVSSISPVDGNIPSFTVARVNPSSSVLMDYDVVEASNQTGIDTHWTTEYNFGQTYHEPDFSPVTVSDLIGKFKADGGAKTSESQAFIHNYFVGDMSREISPFWPEYVCALDHYTAKDFAACFCSAAK